MFEDHNKNLNMLKGAYKKLKSFYYYDKSILHIKLKIACFANVVVTFADTFEKLAVYLETGDTAFEQLLIEQIDYRVLPKKWHLHQMLQMSLVAMWITIKMYQN